MPRPNGADWGHEADAAVLPGPFPLTDPLTDRGPHAVVKYGGTIGHPLPHGGELGRFTRGGGRPLCWRGRGASVLIHSPRGVLADRWAVHTWTPLTGTGRSEPFLGWQQ